MNACIKVVKNIFKLSVLTIIAFSCNKQVNNTNDEPVVLQPAGSAGINVSVYYQSTYKEVETTYVDEVAIDSLNYNGDSVLTINNSGFESETAANALLKFNNLPANNGKNIKSAVLYLYGINPSSASYRMSPYFNNGDIFMPNITYPENINPISLRLQKITTSWDASAINWHTQPVSVNDGSIAIQLTDSTWNNDAKVDITEMVQSWITNPDKNYGCRLRFVSVKGDEAPFVILCNMVQAQFYSSYATNPNLRPKLVITYD